MKTRRIFQYLEVGGANNQEVAAKDGWSHRDHSLQANTEVLFLVKLELLQGHPSLSDEFVVSKLVLVTHGEPGDRQRRGSIHFRRHTHARTRTPRGSDGRRFSPQGFARHLLVADAVVDQRLVPHGVQSVLQGLGAELVGLERKQKKFSNK